MWDFKLPEFLSPSKHSEAPTAASTPAPSTAAEPAKAPLGLFSPTTLSASMVPFGKKHFWDPSTWGKDEAPDPRIQQAADDKRKADEDAAKHKHDDEVAKAKADDDAKHKGVDHDHTAAELSPKDAEKARQGLHADIQKLDLTAEQKKLIDARTKGLSGDALVKEMSALKSAMSGPNADRALAAYADIDKMVKEEDRLHKKHGSARITPEVMAELVTGVANSRTEEKEGQSGVLGGAQARDAARTLMAMNDDEYKRTDAMLKSAGKSDGKLADGADPAAEQALILKAVAARSQTLAPVMGGSGVVADNMRRQQMDELEAFANDIRGQKRHELVRNTSGIDLEGDKAGADGINHHGIYQRFASSCGPTAVQMAKAEGDPVYALRLHKDGFEDNDPNGAVAQEQKKMIEAEGHTVVSPETNKLAKDLRSGMPRDLAVDEQYKINDYLTGKGGRPDANLIKQMRDKNGGKPTDAQLGELDKLRTQGGLSNEGIENALGRHDMNHINLDDPKQQGDLDKKLRDGQVVPIAIQFGNGGGHAMMISDSRGTPGKREYLLSDPQSGTTQWVSEAEMKAGQMWNNHFNGPNDKPTTAKVDVTY